MLNCIKCKEKSNLKIFKDKIEIRNDEYEDDFILKVLNRIDKELFLNVCKENDIKIDLNDLNLVKKYLFNFHIIEGRLECDKCNFKYKISEGIPIIK